MKYLIIIGSLVFTLAGWFITYEPFGQMFYLDETGQYPVYWYWYDVCISAPLFLNSLWAHGHISLNKTWKHIARVVSVYFGLNLLGVIIGINEKGNWFVLLTGAIFIYLVALVSFRKWATKHYYWLQRLSAHIQRLYN